MRGHSQEQLRAREVRRTKIAELWCRCVPIGKIAQQLGVTPRTICSDMKANRAEWRRIRPEAVEERTLDELDRLDRLECTYWEAWDRSLKDAETHTVKTVTTANGERTEGSERQEGQCGDPRFLDGVFKCINRRIELLGLDPVPGSSPQTPLYVTDAALDRLTPDDLRTLILLRQRAAAAGGTAGQAN